MKEKNILITSFVTIFLFLLVLILIYIIYCFAFYDKNLRNDYLINFNTDNYDFVYDNLENSNLISKEDYNESINLMFRINYIKKIHDTYYSDINLDEFINKYYYGNNIELKDISFLEEGKTSLFKRETLKYEKITIRNRNGDTSYLKVFKNLKLEIDSDTLLLDDKKCEIVNNECSYDYILGGLHTIKYVDNKIMYFGIINVTRDDLSIDVSTLDNLVKVE